MDRQGLENLNTRPGHRARGFTMIEIMVAVGILVVVAAMVMVAVSGLNDKANRSKTQAQMKMLAEAITAFKSATGSFPLSVPEDALDGITATWQNFTTAMNWRTATTPHQLRWTNYFKSTNATADDGVPDYSWPGETGIYPTNIHMLGFQLEQVPESNKIFSQIKEKSAITVQKTFTHPGTAPGIETWTNASGPCQLAHPLDAAGTRTVYQVQDAWGTPLRFWTSDTLAWAKSTTGHTAWDASIQSLLSSRLQQANWGFIIESAGKDGKFGWWGQSGIDLTTAPYAKQITDNVYSVGE
jgi:prepilin-type N-terminal cleavage/methylation domain-containing protein